MCQLFNNNEKEIIVIWISNPKDKLFADRELTGAEKTLAEETDIDAEEVALPDSAADEFSRGVTDLDAAKEDDEDVQDSKVNSCTSLWLWAWSAASVSFIKK